MEFRAPTVATELNNQIKEYFTGNLSNPKAGLQLLAELMVELGNAVDSYPDWHQILTAPKEQSNGHIYSMSDLKIYRTCDHTREFVRGFITCPYSESEANRLMNEVNKIPELQAYRPDGPLYADNAYPVVVLAHEIALEADGTIRSRDAIRWFVQQAAKEADTANVAETWWNIRSLILGQPHGSRSSLFVNQHAGAHMRKILEALNNSGLYGRIKESSLEMLSKKNLDSINETLLRAAIDVWDKSADEFSFELRGEICNAAIHDTWGDGEELSIRVQIGEHDLFSRGFYYAKKDRVTYTQPTGKKAMAKKFL